MCGKTVNTVKNPIAKLSFQSVIVEYSKGRSMLKIKIQGSNELVNFAF